MFFKTCWGTQAAQAHNDGDWDPATSLAIPPGLGGGGGGGGGVAGSFDGLSLDDAESEPPSPGLPAGAAGGAGAGGTLRSGHTRSDTGSSLVGYEESEAGDDADESEADADERLLLR